jgi:hypothetical protein
MTSEDTALADAADAQMTDSTVGYTITEDDPSAVLFDSVVAGYREVLSGHPALFVVFALLGVVRAAVYLVRDALEIPQYAVGFPTQGTVYFDLTLLPTGPTVAYPLPGTFRGLVPELLAVYALTTVAWLLALTLAVGAVAWRTAPGTAGWLPPGQRLARLGAFAVVAQVLSIPLLEGFISGIVLTTVLTLVVVYLLTRLFVAPVTIVRDGRGLRDSVAWSWRATRRTWSLFVVFVLAFALVRYWITGLPVPPGVDATVPVHAFLGTTILGGAYAVLLCVAYDITIALYDGGT